MNLIEKLGLEKCKQIVDSAPKIANFYIPSRDAYSYVGSDLLGYAVRLKDIKAAIAYHATLKNNGSIYKAQTMDTIYLCTIVDGLILNDSCVITVTFTGSTSVVLIGSSKQMIINRVGDVINLLFNNESYSLKKDQIEAALRPYLGSRTLIQAFG